MGGFTVPERSVQTHVVADWFLHAIKAQPEITTYFNCRVTGLTQRDKGWRINATPALDGPFDIVINALWEGRAAIDATAGIADGEAWSYRYRQLLFARTARPCDLPSAMIATGPFGDIKNYNGRDLYVSWYPAGLAIDTTDVAAQGEPANDPAMQRALIEGMLLRLARMSSASARGARRCADRGRRRVGRGAGARYARGRNVRPASARSLRRAAKRLVYFGRYRQVFDGSVARATDRRGSDGLENREPAFRRLGKEKPLPESGERFLECCPRTPRDTWDGRYDSRCNTSAPIRRSRGWAWRLSPAGSRRSASCRLRACRPSWRSSTGLSRTGRHLPEIAFHRVSELGRNLVSAAASLAPEFWAPTWL